MFASLLVLFFCANSFCHNIDNSDIDLSHFGLDIFGKPVAYNSLENVRKYGNPEERGPYLEGDLLIPLSSKNGIKSESFRWKNGEVPYQIRGSFSRN